MRLFSGAGCAGEGGCGRPDCHLCTVIAKLPQQVKKKHWEHTAQPEKPVKKEEKLF